MSKYPTVFKRLSHLTPEIKLRLMDSECPSWTSSPFTDSTFAQDPFWAVYWPGGQALSRYILDNPSIVQNKRVLDIGSGCGASAIAAKMMGASKVLANDVDPEALIRVRENAAANSIADIETSDVDYLKKGLTEKDFDLIFMGDMFYDLEMVEQSISLIKRLKKGCLLIGDPGRWALKEVRPNMECLAKYELTPSTKNDNYGFNHGYVYKVLM